MGSFYYDTQRKKFVYQEGGRSYGKTQATSEWRERVSGKGELIPVMPAANSENRQKWAGWFAPTGWNAILRKGNFAGCRPLFDGFAPKINPHRFMNIHSIETLNFEMV